MAANSIIFLVVVFFYSTAVAANPGLKLFEDGYHYWQQGNALKAYAFFEQIRDPTPPIDDLRLYVTAAAAQESGRRQLATTLFQKLVAEYPNSTWSRAAEHQLTKGNTPNLASENLSESMRMQLAAKAIKSGLPADAVALLQPLVNVSGGNVRGAADVLELFATAAFKARDYSHAAPVLAELLKRRGGSDVTLMVMLASAYARSDQFDAAIATQRKIMAFPGETKKAQYKIAFLEFDRGNDRAVIAAAQNYLQHYNGGREADEVLWMKAWSHFRLKDWSSAISTFELYRDATHSADEKLRAAYWIARSLSAMGNSTGTAAAFGMLAQQNSGGYYGHLASARLRRKPVQWQLLQRKGAAHAEFGDPDTPIGIISKMGFYELLPAAGLTAAYREFVQYVAPAWGLTPELVLSLMYVESHFRPEAVSPAGAVGLMQIIPPTANLIAQVLRLDGVFKIADLKIPVWNVMLGMAYLRKLSNQFSRQLVPVIASYNAGEEAVTRWMKLHSLSDMEIFVEEIPYDETRAYVKKVIIGVW